MIHEPISVEQIARICHEANRAYCRVLGDDSQVAWDDAPEWQKDSAMTGVSAILTEPTTTPEQSHQGWMDQKIKDGWVYGTVKDVDLKTHPCMVSYDELPSEQRVKDSIFGAVVRVFTLP